MQFAHTAHVVLKALISGGWAVLTFRSVSGWLFAMQLRQKGLQSYRDFICWSMIRPLCAL